MKTLLAILLLAARIALAGDTFLGVILDDEPVSLDKYGEKGLAVRVDQVVDGSPAEKAGIRDGDLFLLFGGKAVTDRDDLSFYLGRHEPGDTIKLVVLRGGEKHTLSAQLGEAPRNAPVVKVFGKDVSSNSGFLGVTTQEINTNLLEFFGVEEGYGVLVDGVVSGSSAEKNGIKVGDVIVQLDDKRVDSIGRLGRLTRSTKPGTTITILIYRDHKPRTLTFQIGSRDHSSLFVPDTETPRALLLDGTVDGAETMADMGIRIGEGVVNGLESSMLFFSFDEENRQEIRESMEEARRDLEENREELRQDMLELREEMRQDMLDGDCDPMPGFLLREDTGVF
ncbi:MAG: PDZ domain-containing protein [Calditrichaeota bacterium]|nr:PDZ domain-containing protein [Candidatus Cloacimonadota bacterium]MCB1046789.1 PDZ domain-containing protein [Calditrichota bacterium]MCB9472922.1 PDZ domain-containing protein [Candidatus Delongbacteria bacterium]